MKNPRAKMRRSNRKAVDYLIKHGYDFVYLIPHIRYDTFTYFKNAKIKSKDIAGFFDGIAVMNGHTYYLQIKSNSWSGWKKIEEFCETYGLSAMMINVKDGNKIQARGCFRIKNKV